MPVLTAILAPFLLLVVYTLSLTVYQRIADSQRRRRIKHEVRNR